MLAITDKEFYDIRRIMFDHTGVRLRESKRALVISRLRKRLEELGCVNFTDYIKRLIPNAAETEYFVNALTTNETFFFRHTKQFNYLYEVVLPQFAKEGKKKIDVWSAASSSGEEAYSIAIALTEFAKENPMDFKIYASDINSEVILDAKEALYDERALKEVPESLRARYLKPAADSKKGSYFTPAGEIKRRVEFFEHNLQEPSLVRGMDIIFLRNVLIYFQRDIKEKVIHHLEPCLRRGGYFFISPSESLNDINTGLRLVGPAIFRKP